MRPRWIGAILFILATLTSRGQEPHSRTFTISDNVNLVVLDVSVKDPRDGYVSGLHKEDFRVFEDRNPRAITQFGNEDLPVTVGLVVDNSGSMLRKRPEVITAGLAFAKESNPRDEFFVINFNNSVVRGLPERTLFTDDLNALRAALYYGQPQGQTALYDAVAYALKHLELRHQERRALIVVSDGGDNVSRTPLGELLRLIEDHSKPSQRIYVSVQTEHCSPSRIRSVRMSSSGTPPRIRSLPRSPLLARSSTWIFHRRDAHWS